MPDNNDPEPRTDPLLSISTLAQHLDVSPKTVRRWVGVGHFPSPDHRIPGGRMRWRQSTLELWLERTAT